MPTIVLHEADDTVSPPRSERDMDMFAPGTERHVVPQAGHFMPREQSQVVIDALLKLGEPIP